MFLKLDGIDDESQDKVHKGEIEISSYSSGGGSGAGRPRSRSPLRDAAFESLAQPDAGLPSRATQTRARATAISRGRLLAQIQGDRRHVHRAPNRRSSRGAVRPVSLKQ